LAVQNLDPANVLIIGDSVDDGNAAREVGARAVLYSGGGDALSALEATGFPVVSTLAAAVNIAISSQGF
jgi:phosphoglycolate phosphatase-like HAD superfamily hydrolase